MKSIDDFWAHDVTLALWWHRMNTKHHFRHRTIFQSLVWIGRNLIFGFYLRQRRIKKQDAYSTTSGRRTPHKKMHHAPIGSAYLGWCGNVGRWTGIDESYLDGSRLDIGTAIEPQQTKQETEVSNTLHLHTWKKPITCKWIQPWNIAWTMAAKPRV